MWFPHRKRKPFPTNLIPLTVYTKSLKQFHYSADVFTSLLDRIGEVPLLMLQPVWRPLIKFGKPQSKVQLRTPTNSSWHREPNTWARFPAGLSNRLFHSRHVMCIFVSIGKTPTQSNTYVFHSPCFQLTFQSNPRRPPARTPLSHLAADSNKRKINLIFSSA